jgi:hypothetical protein
MSPFWPGEKNAFDEEDVILQDEDWYLLKIDKLGGYKKQKSVIGHHCQKLRDPQWLDEADCMEGACWWCGKKIPDSIKTVWTFQNWENLPKFDRYRYDHHETRPPTRLVANMIYNIPRHRYMQLKQKIGEERVNKHYAMKQQSMTWGPVGNLFDA